MFYTVTALGVQFQKVCGLVLKESGGRRIVIGDRMSSVALPRRGAAPRLRAHGKRGRGRHESGHRPCRARFGQGLALCLCRAGKSSIVGGLGCALAILQGSASFLSALEGSSVGGEILRGDGVGHGAVLERMARWVQKKKRNR